MTAQLIDGTSLAKSIRAQVQMRVAEHMRLGRRSPCLAVILVGNDPASEIYVGRKIKACSEVGIANRDFHLPAEITQATLSEYLYNLNDDPNVDGILVQMPLPPHLSRLKAIEAINPSKDVDGLTPANQGRLVWHQPALYPCTPLGIMELIKTTGVPVQGKLAVVLGRSVLVGAPTCNMLSNAGASVLSLHSLSDRKAELSALADILVVATGVKHLVKADWVKEGAIVIDVGIHREGKHLTGDVDFVNVAPKASYITPVPGGVGPMTIAMLMQNCVKSYEQRLDVK